MSSGIDELLEAIEYSVGFDDAEDQEDFYLDKEYAYTCAAHTINQQRRMIDAMQEAMQTFIDRVDKGEVRSRRTYAQFKRVLRAEE